MCWCRENHGWDPTMRQQSCAAPLSAGHVQRFLLFFFHPCIRERFLPPLDSIFCLLHYYFLFSGLFFTCIGRYCIGILKCYMRETEIMKIGITFFLGWNCNFYTTSTYKNNNMGLDAFRICLTYIAVVTSSCTIL